MEVGSTKDLKPESLTWVRRTERFGVSKMIPSGRCFSAASSEFFHAFAPEQTPADICESVAPPRLPDLHGDSGIHLPVPDDGPAGFRGAVARVRSRPAVRGVEVAQALRLVVPRRRRLSRGSDQPHPRRPRQGDEPALHAPDGQVQRARRHSHERGGGTPQIRLEAGSFTGLEGSLNPRLAALQPYPF